MSALVPAAIPICRLPIVELAAPDTPSTAGFGEFVLIVTVPVPLGAVPVDQLLPTVQSVLVVPFHTCALADADQPHMTIAPALTPASSARDRRFAAALTASRRQLRSDDPGTQRLGPDDAEYVIRLDFPLTIH